MSSASRRAASTQQVGSWSTDHLRLQNLTTPIVRTIPIGRPSACLVTWNGRVLAAGRGASGDAGSCGLAFSDNLGQSWTQAVVPASAGEIFDMIELANGILLAVGFTSSARSDFGVVLRSTDNGLNWTEIRTPPAAGAHYRVFRLKDSLFLGGFDNFGGRIGCICVSNDMGFSWSVLSDELPGPVFDFHKKGDTSVWAVTEGISSGSSGPSVLLSVTSSGVTSVDSNLPNLAYDLFDWPSGDLGFASQTAASTGDLYLRSPSGALSTRVISPLGSVRDSLPTLSGVIFGGCTSAGAAEGCLVHVDSALTSTTLSLTGVGGVRSISTNGYVACAVASDNLASTSGANLLILSGS